MTVRVEKDLIEPFFCEIATLFNNLSLPPCDIWVAGSYARGEQRAYIKNGKICSDSDLELLIVARNPSKVRARLRDASQELAVLIHRYFDQDQPLDFDYWVVNESRFYRRPCVLFFDAVLAGKHLYIGLCTNQNIRPNRFLTRDFREILIHRAANQVLYATKKLLGASERENGSIVARNILDLLTVHFYSRGIFLPSYSLRTSAIDHNTNSVFGQQCAAVFDKCLKLKLGDVRPEELLDSEKRELEVFFFNGLWSLFELTKALQKKHFKEDNLNYSGLRTVGYRLRYLIEKPSKISFCAVFTPKETIFKLLMEQMEILHKDVLPENFSARNLLMKELLLSNYPYLKKKMLNESL